MYTTNQSDLQGTLVNHHHQRLQIDLALVHSLTNQVPG